MSCFPLRVPLAIAVGAALASCSGAQGAVAVPVPAAGDLRVDANSNGEPHVLVHLTAQPTFPGGNRGRVAVDHIREPGDFAHRNYCGPGATQVLLSAWLDRIPDLELIALRSKLNPKRGEYGAMAVLAINGFLNPIVVPALGHPRYRAERVLTLAAVKDRIRRDILDPNAIRLFGHGAPIMVQTMTGTLPGWNHWNATHMITVFAFDFSHNDPALDTVTYVETSSRLTGYRGKGLETITMKALWTAMHAFIVQAPYDPMNVIS
jgi:hypothetical protein